MTNILLTQWKTSRNTFCKPEMPTQSKHPGLREKLQGVYTCTETRLPRWHKNHRVFAWTNGCISGQLVNEYQERWQRIWIVCKGNRSSLSRFVKIQFPKNEKFRKTISYQGPFVRKNIPKSLRVCNDFNICTFKLAIKKHVQHFLSRWVRIIGVLWPGFRSLILS